MEVKVGFLYHIKDEFFDRINDKELMINHEKGHSRPSYLAIKDKDILWFVPLSTRVEKYKSIIDKKVRKYGSCKSIVIKRIAGKEQVILVQNAFPTINKYIKSRHTVDGKYVYVSDAVKREILDNFNYMLSLKEEGLNLFFTDIDKIKQIMLDELN